MEAVYVYFVLAFLVAIIASIRGRPGWRWFLVAVFTTPLIGGLLVMALPREQPPFPEAWPPLTAAPEVVPMPADSTIRIIRLASTADRLMPYHIYANGVEIGTVRNHSIADFAVPSGPLTIEARIDWGRSPPLRVEAPTGGRVNIAVANRWGALFSLWGMAFRYRRYLTLTLLPPEPEAAAEVVQAEETAPIAAEPVMEQPAS
jgi:hypothetical protein